MKNDNVHFVFFLSFISIVDIKLYCIKKLKKEKEQISLIWLLMKKTSGCRKQQKKLAEEATLVYQSQVSILGPVGYGPTTLPLRHSDLVIILFETNI